MSASPSLEMVLDRLVRWSTRWSHDGARSATIVEVGSTHDTDTRALRGLADDFGLDLRTHHCEVRPAEAVERYGANTFDYALVGPELREQNDVERLTTLRAAERLARQGLLWTGTLAPPLRAAPGMRRAEVLDIRRRLSMGYLKSIALPRLGGPFLLAGEFADAWTGLGDTHPHSG
ncbi:MAG: hypothetical protein Tsb0013_21040 [Phycisphaerales bacterium]